MKLYNKISTPFFICMLSVLAASKSLMAQQLPDSIIPPELGPYDTIPVPAIIEDRQLVPMNTLEWVWVTAKYPPHLLKKRQEWTRLRNAVYVTYPYARKAGVILNDINAQLANVSSKQKRKKIILSREKELKKEFTDPLTNLSVYQGKVLMKLINRQTGNNCYDIIKEYKGGFTARVWQTVAFFFSSNLKQPYDAAGPDKEIESIVREVESMYGFVN